MDQCIPIGEPGRIPSSVLTTSKRSPNVRQLALRHRDLIRKLTGSMLGREFDDGGPSSQANQEGNSDSIAIAVASPPPMQIEATPFRAPLACMAPSSVTMMRAPDAPIG